MAIRFDIAGMQIDGARDYQEDAFLITNLKDDDGDPSALVIMADGMGGHAAGNVASNMAVQGLNKKFSSAYPVDQFSDLLNLGIMEANIAIQKTVAETPALAGMGCTMVAAAFDHGNMWWVSVGDSHLYLIRDRQLIKKNADHSYGGFLDRMQEAGTPVEPEAGLSRNMLMSALVGEDIPEVDLPDTPMRLKHGDRVIVASDGLDTLSEGMIIQYSDWSETAKECAEALLKAIEEIDKPRQDNTTVIVVDVIDDAAAAAATEEEVVEDDPGEITQPRDAVVGIAEEAPPDDAGAGEVDLLLESEPEPAPEPAPQPESTPVKLTQPPPLRGSDLEDRKRKPVGLIVGIVVIVVAIAAWLVLGQKPAPGPAVGEMPAGEEAMEGAGDMEAIEPESVPEEAGEAPVEESAPAAAEEPVESAPEAVSSAPASGKTLRDKLKSGGEGPEMAVLPAGTFTMGGRVTNYDEQPRHAVRIAAFAMNTHETTVAEYARFAKATGREMPVDVDASKDDYPMVMVTWDDVVYYAKWLSKETGHTYRLPSEAEWEYAAGTGKKTEYWWGRKVASGKAHCFGCGSDFDPRKPTRPGRFAPNAFGLYDTAGNVQEWTQDCFHENYDGAPADGAVWAGGDCSLRVVRGGAYSSPPPALRHASRDKLASGQGYDNVGIRLVRELD